MTDSLEEIIRDELNGHLSSQQIPSVAERLSARLVAQRYAPADSAPGDPGPPVELPDRVTAPGHTQSGYRLMLFAGAFAAVGFLAWIASSTLLVLNDKSPLDMEWLVAVLAPLLPAFGYHTLEIMKKRKASETTARIAEAKYNR